MPGGTVISRNCACGTALEQCPHHSNGSSIRSSASERLSQNRGAPEENGEKGTKAS